MRAEELYLKDIVAACQVCTPFANEVDWDFFEKSGLYQSAIQFNLMIIGEAGSKISRGLRSRHPQVDWQTIKAFRNILAHEYFALDLEIIWDSARTHTALLAEQIREILRVEYPGSAVAEEL